MHLKKVSKGIGFRKRSARVGRWGENNAHIAWCVAGSAWLVPNSCVYFTIFATVICFYRGRECVSSEGGANDKF
jgi:hypothetical protein